MVTKHRRKLQDPISTEYALAAYQNLVSYQRNTALRKIHLTLPSGGMVISTYVPPNHHLTNDGRVVQAIDLEREDGEQVGFVEFAVATAIAMGHEGNARETPWVALKVKPAPDQATQSGYTLFILDGKTIAPQKKAPPAERRAFNEAMACLAQHPAKTLTDQHAECCLVCGKSLWKNPTRKERRDWYHGLGYSEGQLRDYANRQIEDWQKERARETPNIAKLREMEADWEKSRRDEAKLIEARAAYETITPVRNAPIHEAVIWRPTPPGPVWLGAGTNACHEHAGITLNVLRAAKTHKQAVEAARKGLSSPPVGGC